MRRSAPAWLFSTILHVLGFVLLALLLNRSSAVAPQEKSRPVGIVLANTAQDVAYWKPTTKQSQQDAAKTAPASSPSSSNSPKHLPPLDAAIPLSALDSPDLPGQSHSGDDRRRLLQDVVASGGGRTPILPGQGDAEILANDPLLNAPPSAPLGPTATMRIFGTKATGRSFVLLIDRSKSMGGEGLGAIVAAQHELKRAFSALRSEQRFQIVAYNQRLAASSPKMLPATDENKKVADKFVGGIVAHGKTEHLMAIFAVLRSKPEVIYVFTDGGDPVLSQPDLTAITLRADGKTTIHCVQFGFGPLQDDDPFLAKLARLNGGSFAYVDMSQSPARGNF